MKREQLNTNTGFYYYFTNTDQYPILFLYVSFNFNVNLQLSSMFFNHVPCEAGSEGEVEPERASITDPGLPCVSK